MVRKLTTEERVKAITLLNEGYSSRVVAEKLGRNVHHTSILRLKKKYQETGSVDNKPVSGRPRKLNDRQERSTVRKILTRECTTAVEVQKSLKVNEDIEVSANTIRRTLKERGLVSRVKKKKPLLSKINIQKRLAFAKRHQNWTVEDWSKVVWSDESKFKVFGSDGKEYYWKRPNEPLQKHHIKPVVKHGGGSVFVWGCFTFLGVGYLTRIDGGLDSELYCQILQDEFLETLEYYDLSSDEIIFMHDNDPKHTAKVTQKWLQDNNIEVLSWPPQSPDLNPIEHIWNDVDRRIRKLNIEMRGKAKLWEVIEKVWNETSIETCTNLISSMPARIRDVLKAKGGHTNW
jgi:transposase